ncbi:hypothetical protein evm_005893 [Chilo suppressalis]|nr:hypothetical protein evm_005893 [Chilo suppressalis]
MNLLIIAIAFSFIQTLTANEQKEEEDITVAGKEPLISESDSDEIAFIEPGPVLRDAVAESELVRSDSAREKEFLIDGSPHVDDLSIAKSGADVEKLNDAEARTINADTKSASSEKSVDQTLEVRTGHEVDFVDMNETTSDSIESVRHAAEDTVSVSEERKGVLEDTDKEISGTSADLENSDPLNGRRMMQEVVDTKARSVEERDLKIGILAIPNPNIQREVNLKPPEKPLLLSQPNMSYNKPVFQPYLPKRPVINYPSQDQSFRNQQTPDQSFRNQQTPDQAFRNHQTPDQLFRNQQTPQTPHFNIEELTNMYIRLNSYPAKERFQGSVPSLSSEHFGNQQKIHQTPRSSVEDLTNQFLRLNSYPAIERFHGSLANEQFTHPPQPVKPNYNFNANFNSNTPVNPIFTQTFTPTYDLQNFNRYNSVNKYLS